MLEHALADLGTHGRLALAVSGGRDSTALMLLAGRTIAPDRLHVLTVDHKLRPEAAEEARCVGRWAERLRLPHTILEWSGEKPKTGMQSAARAARYSLMTAWCRAQGFDALVTAHTLDDQAETVLMRLRRGSGVDGLSAMPPEGWRCGTRILRPLLDVSRKTLGAFLRDQEHSWIDDPSNENEAFERIRLRKNWALVEEIGLERHQLARTANRLARARVALDHAAGELLGKSVELSELGVATLHPDRLVDAPEEIRLRALSRCLQAVGGGEWPARDDALERVLEWTETLPSPSITLAGCRLAASGDKVTVARELGRIAERAVPVTGDEPVFWDNRFQVSASGIAGNVTAGPVGTEDWALLKDVRPAILAFAGRSLPALRQGGKILAVPSIGYLAPEAPRDAAFSAVFANHGLVDRRRHGHFITASS